MISALYDAVNSRLWIKVMLPVSLSVLLVMGLSLWLNVKTQLKLGMDQLGIRNHSLVRAVEGGMFDSLAVGDNDRVRGQFKRLGENLPDLKVYVYDFNRTITFSTDPGAVGQSVNAFAGKAVTDDIAGMIRSGQASGQSFVIQSDAADYTVQNEPILNEEKCFHCHGKRTVLGGISVLSSMAAVQAGINRGRAVSILIFIAGLAATIFLVWFIFIFLVSKKVVRVLDTAEHMRQKDFSRDIEVVKGDEINRILNRINTVIRELRSAFRNIIDNSAGLTDSAGKMSRIAQTLDTSSAETSRKAAKVSGAAKEMNATNQAVAETMDDAAQAMISFAAAVDEMSATLNEISRNSSESKSIAHTMTQGFNRLLSSVRAMEERARDVDAVTAEIRSVSSQVSLLALNAKIEAARAGEAGKGFAVVAQEITELATDSSQSTLLVDEKLAGIKSMVQDLLSQVSDLSQQVENSDRAVSGIAESVEEQSVSTLQISQNLNHINDSIATVNRRVSQGAETAGDIAHAIAGVEQMSASVGKESHELNGEAQKLARLAQGFSDLMKQFKV